MKNLMKFGFMATVLGAMMFLTSCDDNEIIVPDPTSEYDGELEITEGNSSSLTIFTTDLEEGATEIKALVTVTAAGDKMKRIYITENVAGIGEEPFELTGTDNKLDGSLDLEGSSANEFSFVLTIPIVGGITAGTIEYRVWATSGRGDYRDSSKRLLAGVGTLTINYGGSNPATDVKSYTAKMFVVPLADGTSKTFVSVLDGQMYRLSDGQEYASFWDFGYYWLNTPGSSLASTSAYPALFNHDSDDNTPLVGIADLTTTPQSELNNCYFAATTMTTGEFDAITKSNELTGIAVSSSDAEKIQNLAVGDVVAFMDSYGNKGLIKVVSIVPGYGSDGEMVIDIKVQP